MEILRPQESFPKEAWIEYADELEKEIERLKIYEEAQDHIGIYPKKVSNFGEGLDYESRTEYHRGWNAAYSELLSMCVELSEGKEVADSFRELHRKGEKEDRNDS